MTSDPAKSAEAAGPAKLAPKDVASATAIGAATRIGLGRRKAKVATGAAAGAAGRRGSSDRASLMTGLLVAGISIGMLVVMIVFSR